MHRLILALPLLWSMVARAGSWGELRDPAVKSRPGPPPRPFQKREALDEMQAVLGQWQKERREFSRDAEAKARWSAEREAKAVVEAEHDAAVAAEGEEAALLRYGKVIEVGKEPKGKAAKTGKGKVIELAPDREGTKGVLEEEMEKAEARAEEVQRKKREDPEGYAREKAKKQALAQGNDAFEEAITRRFQEREKQIEKEAVRMQDELNAARRREELIQAQKLGGTLDKEGNFVDPELSEEEKKE